MPIVDAAHQIAVNRKPKDCPDCEGEGRVTAYTIRAGSLIRNLRCTVCERDWLQVDA